MNDWFEWNGVRCTTLGIHVSEQPEITLPKERVTFTDVPGRSGSLTTLEGENVYDDMTLTATCFIESTANINAVAAFLRGSGTVTFANRQGGYYNARIVNQISFEKILRGNAACSFAVNFRCKPFFYFTPVADISVTTQQQFLTNPGCIPSEPMITVIGSGDITLMIGQQIIDLTDVEDHIILDSELQEAYYGSTAMNEKLEGDFPLLQPGVSAFSWEGSVTDITVKPRWRTL